MALTPTASTMGGRHTLGVFFPELDREVSIFVIVLGKPVIQGVKDLFHLIDDTIRLVPVIRQTTQLLQGRWQTGIW
jgi:hypothetical protein